MLTPEERERFDAIAEAEQARDPFFRFGKVAGMIIVPIIGLILAALLLGGLAAGVLVACSGGFA